MNVAFASFTGMLVGGVPSYVYRLANGFRKIGHEFKFVFITRGNGSGLINAYTAAGLREGEYIVASKDAVDILNRFDFVIFDQACGYKDLGNYKHNSYSIPWYYFIFDDKKLKVPVTAIIHTHLTYTKHSPYISIWEDVCSFFIASRETVAIDYMRLRGNLDVYILDTPIDCDCIDSIDYGKRRVIVSTSRLDPIKRQHHLVQAANQLHEWKIELHSGENVWHYRDKIMEMIGDSNVSLHEEDKILDLDEIYDGVSLLYNATLYPSSTWGGVESATLEGVVRGAVPLLSHEWVEPNSGAIPCDACYKFSISDGKSNLVEVISNIDPGSRGHKKRWENVKAFVKETNSDRVAAEKLLKVLS